MNKDDIATKKDVEEIVGRVVGGIMSDALQLIAGQFNKQDAKITKIQTDVSALQGDISDLKQDNIELHTSLNRIENKLDATVDQVDDHAVHLKRFKHKLA